MSTVSLTNTNVLAAYKNADATGKKLLKDLLNGQVAFDEKIIDRVKSFEDACAILVLNPKDVLGSTCAADEIAYIKLKTIVSALNEGWKPNWKTRSENKYYPWWDMEDGFVLYGVHYDYAGTNVSSRLCFKNEALAKYAADQFINLYKDYMLVV